MADNGIELIKVEDLIEGDAVDLEGDGYADPKAENPYLGCEFVLVELVEREAAECVAVYFGGFDCVGFPLGHAVKVRLPRPENVPTP
jgi:hypothetical protein